MRKLLITVLYKTAPEASETLRSLVAGAGELYADDVLYLADNSPQPQDTSFADSHLPCRVAYRHSPENLSLAAIYNRAVSEFPGQDFLFLFDQDSGFGGDYFRETEAAAAVRPDVNLFVPLIRQGTTVVSPGHFHYFKGRYWSEARYGAVPAKNTVAIASGMAIRMKYLKGFGGFEERLQLYGIDSNFMIRYSRDNALFYVLKAPFNHDLSDFNSESRETRLRRFRDFSRASLINAELFPLPVRLLTWLFIRYRKLRFR